MDKKQESGIQILDFEFGGQVNGFEVEPAKVDDDDLMTLREIARLINGNSNSFTGMADRDTPKDKQADARPATSSRKKVPKAKAKSVKKPPRQTRKPVSKPESKKQPAKNIKHALRPAGAPVSGLKGGDKNYFLESLPVALAIALGGRLMLANEAFLYAFGYGSENELRKAGGLPVLFPDSQNGVMMKAPVSSNKTRAAHKSARSGQVTMLAISRSGRKRQIPVAFRNVSTGREPVQILILHEEALTPIDDTPPSPANEDQDTPLGGGGQDSLDFLATVSHEVRTPLNSIIGFSELMKDERFGPVDAVKFRDYAEDIHESALHALSLINDLLDITKIVAGKPDLDFEAVDLELSAKKVVKLMRSQAEQRKITVRTSLAKNLPALIADKRALKQILLNLLSNALKFTSPGDASPCQPKAVQKQVSSSKSPIQASAMREDQISTALEPFAQLNPSRQFSRSNTPEPEKGTGLGLPLTKALVKAHFARFSIDSTPGQGTSIEILFPPERLADRA